MVGEKPEESKKVEDSDPKRDATKAVSRLLSEYNKRRKAIENLSFYEGVMVGAYMNWLISFIDKLNVERAEAFRYYVLAETITISILILSLISYLLWTPRSWRLWGIHIISVGVIIALENMQNLQPNLLKLIIFYSVGTLLWAAIQLTERIRPIYRLREN